MEEIILHQLQSHPIVKQFYDLMQEFEKLPASEQQTKCVVELNKLGESFQKYYNELLPLLREARKERDELKQAMVVLSEEYNRRLKESEFWKKEFEKVTEHWYNKETPNMEKVEFKITKQNCAANYGHFNTCNK